MDNKIVSGLLLALLLIGTVALASTIRECAAQPPPVEFQFSNLTISPSSLAEGQTVTISIDVVNAGDTEITGPVTLVINGVVEKTVIITLAAGETKTVTYTVTKPAGTYTVTFLGTTLTGSFTVVAVPTTPSFVTDNKLVYESGATYQWLDPHVSYYQYDRWTLWHSVEMLLWYERDNSTKIIPWLAESYTVRDDGLQYNFTLREGITFQDGTPFNATAVWFSLNRILIIDGTSGTGVHGSQAAWMVQQLLDPSLSKGVSGDDQPYDAAWVQAVLDQNFVEIIDTYEVSINILTPTTQFLPIMAGPWAGIVSPTATIKMDYEHGWWGTWDGDYSTYFEHMAGNGDTALNLPTDGWKVGTGAYYVESVESVTPYTIILKAYDDYWGGPDNMNLPPAGKTRIETIEFIQVESFTTRLLHLKTGTATGIHVATSDIFQVVDRDRWIDEGILESIVPGVTEHGVFPQFTTWWLCFNTNKTNPDGTLKEWQPFADWRIRMAVASAVNMTHMNIFVNNRFGVLASNIVPPGTVPEGSYNPDVAPAFSFNLTRTRELLIDAGDTPKNPAYYSDTYYNGTAIDPAVVDNSFGPSFASAKIVEFYVQSGATIFQEVLTTLADNLNAICVEEDLGIRFVVVIVPGGQQYTLASQHVIDSYVGGWIADYNHVLNWLSPMYRSTGTYFSWNLWNITQLDTLYDEAVLADQEGNITGLLEINDEMNTLANQLLPYMVWWHPTSFYTRSAWLQGWYVNTNYGVDLWSTMYYESPYDGYPPVAAFAYSPTEPEPAEMIVFDASESYDPDGSVVSYLWDFGDGETSEDVDPETTHAYTTAGTYTVTLTVTDDDELTDTATAILTIMAAIHDVAVTFAEANPTHVVAGQPVYVTVTVRNEGTVSETFDVTAYYDGNAIDTRTVWNLSPGAYDYLWFEWNTAGISEGSYTIEAEASLVPGESDPADNTYVDGVVTIDVPSIAISPESGPVGTKVRVEGSGFPTGISGYLMFDDQLVGFAFPDIDGSFEIAFNVPLSEVGYHAVQVIIPFYPQPLIVEAAFIVVDTTPLGVQVDIGALYFKGETAEGYVETTFKGVPVDATSIDATLYKPDGTVKPLPVREIALGLYKLEYDIRGKGSMLGTYTVVVEANYRAPTLNATGTALRTFIVKSPWREWERHTRNVALSLATIAAAIGLIFVWRRDNKKPRL